MHYIPTAKMEAAILAAIQRVSWYVRHNEAEFIERVREASDQHQENAVKEYRQKVSTPKPHIGHYGRLRKAYLEQYRHRLYTALVASEKLYPHLAETDRAARDMLDYLMPRLAREAGATEALKAADPMKWVGLMNNCKARAEEIVMHELIYV